MQMNDEVKKVLQKYPTLKYDAVSNTLTGILAPFPNDNYELRIELENLNHKFPEVFEVGERIPNHLDRHIYPLGNFCFTTTAKEQILLGTLVKKLVDFIEYILNPYLKNNSYYEINGNYKFGEYSHSEGILEGYKEILQIDNVDLIINVLGDYVQGKRLTSKQHCYCGSKKQFGKCLNRKHQQAYKKMQHIKLETLAIDFNIIGLKELSEKMILLNSFMKGLN
jgi:hypothetical protein